MHTAFMNFLEQLTGILIRTITRGYLVIITDIIARIIERRIEERVKPNGIHTKTLHIVQFADDALNITDTIAVGIAERLRIDLVKHGILCPFWYFGHFIFARDCLRCGTKREDCYKEQDQFSEVYHRYDYVRFFH